MLSDIRGNFELILNRLIFLMPSAAKLFWVPVEYLTFMTMKLAHFIMARNTQWNLLESEWHTSWSLTTACIEEWTATCLIEQLMLRCAHFIHLSTFSILNKSHHTCLIKQMLQLLTLKLEKTTALASKVFMNSVKYQQVLL